MTLLGTGSLGANCLLFFVTRTDMNGRAAAVHVDFNENRVEFWKVLLLNIESGPVGGYENYSSKN